MKRIYYIDWLRIIAIITVFFFHSSRFFDPLYWHVKNPQQSGSVLIFLGFVNLWIMPLFFFLSGASSIFGVKKPFKSYLNGKFTRLIIPYIIGVLLIIPPQKYVEALSNHTFTGGYIDFLRTYFSGGIINYKIGFSPLWIGALSYHLWFLGHLAVISLLLFPLMRLISNKGEATLNRLQKVTSFQGGALLMFIPVAIARVVLKRHFPDYTGWCDLTVFSLYFLWGFIYTINDGLKKSLLKSQYPGLITGSVLFVLYIASYQVKDTTYGQLFQNFKVYGYYVFQETAGSLVTWSWIVFFLATGMRYFNSDSKYRQPLNEAVMPFYILHQTVLLLIGYIVVQWNWNNWGKFGFIAASSGFLICIIYMLVIKPYNPVRYMFGMSRK
jgi:glucans biosynthesis protein C